MLKIYDGLRPCPFCGAEPRMWRWNGGIRIDCSRWSGKPGHEHFVGVAATTEEEVVRMWNGERVTLD